MSAQTGTTIPQGPVSKKVGDRARYRFRRLIDEPNPLWIRELRQSARLVRTPVILCVLAVLTTLLIASVGGLVSMNESPATTGYVLFQVFFSIAYFVVTFVGPGVAANAIAAEREGRTWEAVILTGLRPAIIARGKFLAAYTSIGMYIVMLAPVGALPFLFGGVTAMETIVAFAFLFLIAGLAVAFGLAISSKMNSLRAALVASLLCAVIVSLNVYGFLGVGLSIAVHRLWSGVPDGPPVWLPTAYARAPFDMTYVALLVVLPIAAAALPAWFLYEVTIANLTSVTDDRSTGLKRWYAACTPIFALATSIPIFTVDPYDRMAACIGAFCAHFVFLMMGVYLFIGDSLGPSRRVVLHWDRAHAGKLRRFFGPSIIKTSALELIVGLGTLAMPTLAGLLAIPASSWSGASAIAGVLLFALYVASFFVFSVGFGAFLRARASTPLAARMILLAVHFLVAIGPWVVAAIAGVVASSGDRSALAIASLSPIYAFLMVDALDRGGEPILVVAGILASVVWSLLGFLFLAMARARTTRVITQHNAALAESDRLLAAEDAAAQAVNAPPPEPPPAVEPATS